MKERGIVWSSVFVIIVALCGLCGLCCYAYYSFVKTGMNNNHKIKKIYKEIPSSENIKEDDSHVNDVRTFTVNGVSFNMRSVYVGEEYFVIGSNIRGIGFRESEFEVDQNEVVQNNSDSDSDDEERDSESVDSEDSDSNGGNSDGMINGYDEWADYDEGPLHNVTLSNPKFYLGETEVTVALWDAVMNDSVSKYESPEKPIVNVSWYDCCLFIDRLNKATGKQFRLPTETEWEIAACGGRDRNEYKRFSGSNTCSDVAWYSKNSNDSIQKVARLEPNELGLYDMSGNVWEWCLDYYKDDYYYLCKYTDPLCRFDTHEKVLRGGSYLEPIERVRAEQKKGRDPNYYSKDCGFRLFLQCDSEDVYQNICETDANVYEYVLISKFYKVEADNAQPLRVKKENIADGIKYTINEDCSFVMKKVEGGDFIMGDPSKNRHVKLTYDYYISDIEVTNELYNIINRKPVVDDIMQFPKIRISYDQVLGFIDSLNKVTGENFRLPTEAEWEFAAKGGNKNKSYRYAGTNSIMEIVTDKVGMVKQHNPNELGLYDMSGNVWEYCLDYYEESFCKYLPNINPVGCPFGTSTVLAKGGGADEDDKQKESVYFPSSMILLDRIFEVTNVGFRLCLSSFKPDLNVYFSNLNPSKISEDGYDVYRLNENISFKMINVKAGTFIKEATEENIKSKMIVNSEKVTIEKDFSIGETEVTQELYYAIMGVNPSPIKNPKGPVSKLSWDDAMAFITKLNELFKTNFRLPTENEWEFAAKGGNYSNGYVFSGSNVLNDVAWYKSNTPVRQCPACATKKANELGLYDMSGNVWELCSDKDDDDNVGGMGGCIFSEISACTFISRVTCKEYERLWNFGFRLVK